MLRRYLNIVPYQNKKTLATFVCSLPSSLRHCSTATSSSSSSSSSSSPPPVTITSFEPIKDLTLLLPPITGGVRISKAVTSRCQCLICGMNIRMNEYRFGLLIQGAGDFAFTSWTHAHCFENAVPLCYSKEAVSTLSKYRGLNLVPRSVIDTVLRVVTGSPQASIVSLLGQKLADDIAAQSLRLQDKVDFFSKVDTDVLIEFLKHNYPNAHAETFAKGRSLSERDSVISFAADSACFGCGGDCQTCSSGGIFVPAWSDPLRYKCTGHLDEFTSCWGEMTPEGMPRVRSFDIASPLAAAQAAATNGALAGRKNAQFLNLVAPPVDLHPPPCICVEKRLQDAISSICNSTSSPLLLQQKICITPLGGTSFFIINPPERPVPSRSSGKSKSAKTEGVSATGIPYDGNVRMAMNECRTLIEELGGSVVTKQEAESRPSEVFLVHPSVEGKGVFSPASAPDSVIPASCRTASAILTLQFLRDCKRLGRRIPAVESAVTFGLNLHYLSGAPDLTTKLKAYEEKKFKATAINNNNNNNNGGTANTSGSNDGTSTSASAEISVVGSVPVDPESGLGSSHKVFDHNNISYSATLVKSDLVGFKNSSYVLQLLEKHDLMNASNNNNSSSNAATSTTTTNTPSQISLIPSADKLQVMQGQPYVVWKRFGRVGDSEGNGSTFQTFTDIYKARRSFERTFKERTGNIWAGANQFVKKPGKYNWLEGSLAQETITNDNGSKKDGKNKKSSSSSKKNNTSSEYDNHPVIAHKSTRNLVSRLFDEKIMQDTMMTMKIDVQKMPLVTLRTETVENGQKVLAELVKLVQEKEEEEAKTANSGVKSSSSTSSSSPAEFVKNASPLMKKIILASNRFNSVIPRVADRGKEFEQLLIDTAEKLSTQAQLLSDLSDILLTRQLSSISNAFGDPLLSKFLALDLAIQPIDLELAKQTITSSTDPERKYEIEEVQNLVQYFHDTQGHTHSKYKLHNVWRIERKEEVARFKPFEKDSRNLLLWHGSRFVNANRILKDGFLIAPAGAVFTGSMFNMGNYSANCITKAANYCQLSSLTTSANPTGLMWLNEVAVGNPTIRTKADSNLTLQPGEDSCWAQGQHTPDPKGYVVDSKHGYTIPAGKSIQRNISTSLIYDEIIVYDVTRVKQRYLVEVSIA